MLNIVYLFARESFGPVFNRIKSSLRPNGIFVGQLFGVRDEWNKKETNIIFHTEAEARDLVRDMKIIEFTEEESDRTLASGTKKHSHIFHIIAQKIK